MAHFFRLIRAFVFLFVVFPSLSPALEVITSYPGNTCIASNYPRNYVGDPAVSASWACGIAGNPPDNCGWAYTSAVYGWNPLFSGQCNRPPPVYSCVDGATLSTNAHGDRICSCAAGLRELNGQCTALPPNCEAGQEWSDDAQACITKPCKANEIRVNGVCVPEPPCPDDQIRVNGVCEPAKCPKAGTPGPYYDVTSKSSFSICGPDKCTLASDMFIELRKAGKVVGITAGTKYTGKTCNKPTTPPDSTNPGDPNSGDPGNTGGGGDTTGGGTPGSGGGTTGGTGSGGTGPSGGTGGDKDPTPRPNPDGNGPGTPQGGTDKPVGGSCPPGTYQAQGKCWPTDPPDSDPDADGKCPAGSGRVNGRCVPYQPEPDEDRDQRDSDDDKPGTFGGKCGGFTCEGDAIQCAIAKEQHRRSCSLYEDKTDESNLYDKEKGKEGNQAKELKDNQSIDLTNRINSDDLFSSSQGVQDLVITVMGATIALPFSKINPSLGVLGNILMAISFLIAIRIVGRG